MRLPICVHYFPNGRNRKDLHSKTSLFPDPGRAVGFIKKLIQRQILYEPSNNLLPTFGCYENFNPNSSLAWRCRCDKSPGEAQAIFEGSAVWWKTEKGFNRHYSQHG